MLILITNIQYTKISAQRYNFFHKPARGVIKSFFHFIIAHTIKIGYLCSQLDIISQKEGE